MSDPFFSPFDPPLSDPRIILDETVKYHLNYLHATHWNAVYARITQETRCRTPAHLAAWLEIDIQEARRVLREETLPLEWLKRLCFRGWLSPSWILDGQLPKYLPYKVPARNSVMGRNLEHRIWTTACYVEQITRSSAAIFSMFIGETWEEQEALKKNFQARRPEWAKTFLMAELREEEDGRRARTRRVFLKWSSHSKNSFHELRKAARLFAPTAFLAGGPKEWERLKSYGARDDAGRIRYRAAGPKEWERIKSYGIRESEGRIGYLADSDYERPGWKVRKIYICPGTDVRLEWDAKE